MEFLIMGLICLLISNILYKKKTTLWEMQAFSALIAALFLIILGISKIF